MSVYLPASYGPLTQQTSPVRVLNAIFFNTITPNAGSCASKKNSQALLFLNLSHQPSSSNRSAYLSIYAYQSESTIAEQIRNKCNHDNNNHLQEVLTTSLSRYERALRRDFESSTSANLQIIPSVAYPLKKHRPKKIHH